MNSFNIEDFSDLVYDKLNILGYEIILSNPTVEGKYPCLELHTPLMSVNKTENATPILSTFQISITCWNEKQRQAMGMTNEVDQKLQLSNFVRTNTSQAVYDEVLQKYGVTITYEVRYNAITNTFNFIK